MTEHVVRIYRDYLIHLEQIYYALPEGHPKEEELRERIDTIRCRLDEEFETYFK
jgi:hypothetical protein